ncbi:MULTISPECIES: hypothetical protein [Methylobacteriaceae]|uniref:Uncharacterized protein n=1 Tax=Methylorubrum thiocyanatum TaxID=47958 RepID=A0AA40S5Q1_9HYPH|nr:hypothetical protein [Methylorubrum thiocyanatum]AWI88375.1 hypothetical protein C0214_09025 [Methylobacterium sp. DM1]MBA8914968.1 hypothetical protein [Methylorubrum thiocyanatum]GJE79375.1 hypothetical protein CJNNKLLH_0701 [Methylorubrum thiocyanatum]
MTLTERQARQRLAKAVEAAGSQQAIARQLPLTRGAAQTAVSNGLLGRQAIHPAVLAYLGLRRDPKTGAIHDDAAPRSTFKFLAVQASGEAGVAAAVALVAATLGRDA